MGTAWGRRPSWPGRSRLCSRGGFDDAQIAVGALPIHRSRATVRTNMTLCCRFSGAGGCPSAGPTRPCGTPLEVAAGRDAPAAQYVMAQSVQRHLRLLLRPAGADREHPGGVRRPPHEYRKHPRSRQAHDRADRKSGVSGTGRMGPGAWAAARGC